MKSTFIIAITLFGVVCTLKGQTLRQRDFFTLDQAVAEHEKLSQAYTDSLEWKLKAAEIRKGILDGAGIASLKSSTELNVIRHSFKKMDGYAVENVAIEAMPGIYLTGNLYSPLDTSVKHPGILCTHGHGTDGRWQAYTQQRCATLARMGAVVFAYDMLGYGDMKQADHKIENVLAAQLVFGTRALDFLATLKEVDMHKIAITGESGGGTQTILLAAVDDRIAVSVPVVMVSGYFFGGCLCESGMPIHVRPTHSTTNVEIAACMAPKPLLLVSDGGDWTKDNPTLALPHIKRIYGFFDKEHFIENVHLPSEKHDYGPSKRQAAYAFLSKHLGLKPTILTPEGWVKEYEEDVLPAEKLQVFNAAFPRPANAVMGNDAVVRAIKNYCSGE